MSLFSVSDGHDFPWLIEEVVPGVAAMVDDIVVGALSREYPLKQRLDGRSRYYVAPRMSVAGASAAKPRSAAKGTGKESNLRGGPFGQ